MLSYSLGVKLSDVVQNTIVVFRCKFPHVLNRGPKMPVCPGYLVHPVKVAQLSAEGLLELVLHVDM
jgi:hypothetical protein